VGLQEEDHQMNRLLITALAAASLTAATAHAASTAPTLKGQEFSAQAKITLEQARAIALKARPGTIADQELEKEGGGSGLRYSFDVRSGGKEFEVGVDAVTGKILENDTESVAKEAQEGFEKVIPGKH
jgi:uncharacterized membrane protein YkoI